MAVAEQVWTVGEDNLLPWVEEAYDEAGVEHPALLSDPEGGATVPYEEIIEAAPDVILAPYSGLTEEQYETLSEIAPTVAFPDAAWTTPWDQTIEITAAALGRDAQGTEVLAGIDEYFASEAEAHPEFAGTTFAGVWDGDGFVYVYTAADSRIEVLTELGLEVAPSVAELDTTDGGFFYELSYEQLDQLDADFIVSYHNTEDEAKAFLTKPELQAIPAVAAGQGRPGVGPGDGVVGLAAHGAQRAVVGRHARPHRRHLGRRRGLSLPMPMGRCASAGPSVVFGVVRGRSGRSGPFRRSGAEGREGSRPPRARLRSRSGSSAGCDPR